jgi:hypothetical protein
MLWHDLRAKYQAIIRNFELSARFPKKFYRNVLRVKVWKMNSSTAATHPENEKAIEILN